MGMGSRLSMRDAELLILTLIVKYERCEVYPWRSCCPSTYAQAYNRFLTSSFYSRVIAIRSFLWIHLRQRPCEALLGWYVCLLSAYSLKFTSIQNSWQIRHSSTILIISFNVLIKRRNYALEKLKNYSISNLGVVGIMMRHITSGLARTMISPFAISRRSPMRKPQRRMSWRDC